MAEDRVYTQEELNDTADRLPETDQDEKPKAKRKASKKKEAETPSPKTPEERLNELLEKGKKAGKLSAKELECIEELNLDSEAV
ncbi:MAG: hypothetical protein ACI4O0_07815, partial [Candidatus Limivicinus sp.]